MIALHLQNGFSTVMLSGSITWFNTWDAIISSDILNWSLLISLLNNVSSVKIDLKSSTAPQKIYMNNFAVINVPVYGLVLFCAEKQGSLISQILVYGIGTWRPPLYARFIRGNTNIYLCFMSFLHIDMICSWKPSSSMTRTYLFYIVNIMGADVLATQGARALAAMIFTMFNRINSVPACPRLRVILLSLWNKNFYCGDIVIWSYLIFTMHQSGNFYHRLFP